MPYIDKKGNQRMSEEDMLVPALKIVKMTPNCTMSDIKIQISKQMKFFPADLEPSPTRHGECRYHQIIGNLISHKDNNQFGKYVNIILMPGKNKNQLVLNKEGILFLDCLNTKEIIEAINEYAENESVQTADSYDDIMDLSEQNNREPILGEGIKNSRYKTNSKLAKTILKRSGYKCEYGNMMGEDHTTFTSKSNVPYLEAHHLIPMKAQKDFGNVNLDREENIVGLCPMCHSVVHYGNFEEKERVLRKIYDARIELLKNCNQKIYITFEELINKYY